MVSTMLIKDGIQPYLSPKGIVLNINSSKVNIYFEEESKVLDLLNTKQMSLDEIRLILKDDTEQLFFEMEAKGLVK